MSDTLNGSPLVNGKTKTKKQVAPNEEDLDTKTVRFRLLLSRILVTP